MYTLIRKCILFCEHVEIENGSGGLPHVSLLPYGESVLHVSDEENGVVGDVAHEGCAATQL